MRLGASRSGGVSQVDWDGPDSSFRLLAPDLGIAWPISLERPIPGPSDGCPGWTTPHYIGFHWAPIGWSRYTVVEPAFSD